jgi:acylphosphatase
VNFRYYTRQQAVQLGLTGWVRNLWDGRVEALAEGEEVKVRQLIEWSRRGPSSARVDDVEIVWEEPSGEFVDFDIRVTGRGRFGL